MFCFGRQLLDVAVRAIRLARNTILIDESALGPRPVLHALCSAVRRGVKVEIAQEPACRSEQPAASGKSHAAVCDPNYRVDSPQIMVIDQSVVITSFFSNPPSSLAPRPIHHLWLIRNPISALAYADTWKPRLRPLQRGLCSRTGVSNSGYKSEMD